MSEANQKQYGGSHYKEAGKTGEEHWDRVWRLDMNYWQAAATKYIERYKLKNGKEDLLKAIHYLEKLIELEYPEPPKPRDMTFTEMFQGGPRMEYTVGEKGPEVVNLPLGSTIVPKDIQEMPRVVEIGAKQKFTHGEVTPTGWTQFVFEGIEHQGCLFTCRECNGKFHADPKHNPHAYHECRGLADKAHDANDAAEATSAYVNQ